MAVMADHRGRDDRITVAADQHGRVRPAPGERDVGGRIVPRPRQAAGLPQRDHGGDVGIPDVGDGKRRNSFGSITVTAPCPDYDAERIEHRLDAAHQLDRDLVFHVGQFVALEHADAVLGGNRSAHPQHDREHHLVDLVPARMKSAVLPPIGWLTL